MCPHLCRKHFAKYRHIRICAKVTSQVSLSDIIAIGGGRVSAGNSKKYNCYLTIWMYRGRTFAPQRILLIYITKHNVWIDRAHIGAAIATIENEYANI